MIIDSRHKRFVINMQLRQCFARASQAFRIEKNIKKIQILIGFL